MGLRRAMIHQHIGHFVLALAPVLRLTRDQNTNLIIAVSINMRINLQPLTRYVLS